MSLRKEQVLLALVALLAVWVGMGYLDTPTYQGRVKPGEMLMLMVHSEAGGMKTGAFEYTLGATEDGPIKPDGNLVMTVITAQ